jgi:trehalose-6-phosphate synthase
VTPGAELPNPFSNLINMIEPVSRTAPDDPQKHQHQTTHTGTNPQSSRLQRRAPPGLTNRQRSSSAQRQGSEGHLTQPWHIQPNPHCNGGLNNAIHSVEGRLKRKLWVGTLGTHTDGYKESLKRNVDRRMLDQCESIPVWIPDGEFEKCYDEFCHQVLWPALHYAIPDAPKTKSFYESASYSQYMAVNQRFADVIVANYREGDIST